MIGRWRAPVAGTLYRVSVLEDGLVLSVMLIWMGALRIHALLPVPMFQPIRYSCTLPSVISSVILLRMTVGRVRARFCLKTRFSCTGNSNTEIVVNSGKSGLYRSAWSLIIFQCAHASPTSRFNMDLQLCY